MWSRPWGRGFKAGLQEKQDRNAPFQATPQARDARVLSQTLQMFPNPTGLCHWTVQMESEASSFTSIPTLLLQQGQQLNGLLLLVLFSALSCGLAGHQVLHACILSNAKGPSENIK